MHERSCFEINPSIGHLPLAFLIILFMLRIIGLLLCGVGYSNVLL